MDISLKYLPDHWINEIVQNNDDVCEIRSNLTNFEDINNWVSEFAKKTNSKWIVRRSRRDCEKIVCSKHFVCHHNSHNKVPRDKNTKGNSKNANCLAFIKIKIKVNTVTTRNRDPFVKKGLFACISVAKRHTHSLNTAETLYFLPADAAVKEQFLEYFQDGMGISESSKYHESVLELREEFEEIHLANSRINPTKRMIRHWHDEWRDQNLGPRNGYGLIQKLEEKRNIYEKEGFTVLHKENPFAVVVITPLMKRAHEMDSASNIVFVDSTSCCDSDSHSITFFLTPCAAGAVPLGIAITKGQSQESYTNAFSLFKGCVENMFCGQEGPKIFLTDNSSAEINALNEVWPQSRNLLCIFHVCQAVWRWLWDSTHKIPKEKRSYLIQLFKLIMYAPTKEDAEKAYQQLLVCHQYENFKSYIDDYWKIKELWCLAWRDATIRGNHTNNFCEVTIRIFKDTVLCRVKAYNVIALIDFSCTVLEKYYSHRFKEFAYGRKAEARLFLRSILKKSEYIRKEDIKEVEENMFLVPSEKDPSVLHNVDSLHGCCTCMEGKHGKFCKHQCAVYANFEKSFPNSPPVSPVDKHFIAYLALGEKTPPLDFFQPFLTTAVSHVGISTTDTAVSHAAISTIDTAVSHAAISTIDTAVSHAAISTIDTDFVTEVENVGLPTDCTEDVNSNVVNINNILGIMKECDEKFGSSSGGLSTIYKRLVNIKSVGQWETFLHTAGSRLPMRRRDGSAIRVQPTSLARRRTGITRGSKRLPSGRPPLGEKCPKKRKRNLSLNIRLQQPNAKSHGIGH